MWVKKLVYRIDSKTDSGIEYKIGIQNNRIYYRKRSIRKEQDRRRNRIVLGMLDHLQKN